MKPSLLSVCCLLITGMILNSSCEIEGCMDPEAENYNQNANKDDGSCEYPVILGCIDSNSVNYDPNANTDDGSCEYEASVQFWSNSISYFDYIRVEINGVTYNQITRDSESAPDCNEGEGRFTLQPGTHDYVAFRTGGLPERWEGSFTLDANECKPILLDTPNDLKVTWKWNSSVGGTDNNQITVINNCDMAYEVTHTDQSNARAERFTVQANSTSRSMIMWDATWKLRFKATSGSTTKAGCLGRYYEIDEDFWMGTGHRLEVTIG